MFDERNDTYKDELEAWDFERVIAEDRAQIEAWNNASHHREDKKTKKKMYAGMTRFQVLQMKQHPELAPLSWRLLCKEWGKVTETSLKQGRSFTVDYREWWLSDTGLIERFKPNNTDALAYYIPDNSGAVNEIFVYQDDRFIDSPRALGKFNEAKIERTAEDERVMHEQLGFIAAQKKLAKDAKEEKHLGKIGSIKTTVVERVIAQPVEVVAATTDEQVPELENYSGYNAEDWAAKALNSM